MRFVLLIFLSFFIFNLSSCNDDFDHTVLNSGKLVFSRDTVYLDTIFTNISYISRD